jgi:phage baseplate assembly protein W
MAAIVIDSLSRAREKSPIYTDLKLDLKLNYAYDPRLESKDVIKDIESSYDIAAIKNSLFNIFTTIPGQKILNPVFGLNLYQFLFTGISDENASEMGEVILRGIQKYEPRVEVSKIYVFPDPENHTYEIGLRLNVPTLNITGLGLKGSLSESGFYLA